MTALLLAEPEPAVRGFLERQLRNDGFDVVSCERAEQLPRAADPDVLVLGVWLLWGVIRSGRL